VILKPMPFVEAIAALAEKGLLPTTLGTDELSHLPAELRRMSIFSARVSRADILDEILTLCRQVVDPTATSETPGTAVDVPTAIAKLGSYLRGIGYAPEPGTEGSLKDLASYPRRELIVRMNTQMVYGLGQHIQANDPEVLDAFPAQELYRARGRKNPRGGGGGNQFSAADGYGGTFWPRKWLDAGGKFYGGGRMIALKDDPIWTKMSRFGNPYPPYDFNSGLGVKPVPRREAVEFGLLAKGQQVKPSPINLRQPLQAGIQALSQPILDALRASVHGAVVKDGILTIEE
jgi:hypothetical protein